MSYSQNPLQPFRSQAEEEEQRQQQVYRPPSTFPSFKPTIDKPQTEEYIKAYQDNPRQFQPEMLNLLDKHAAYYKLPFSYNEEDNKATIGSVIKNVGQGFIEGFTTLPVSGKDKPTNSIDAIAKNLGHLAGFIGYVPATPLKLLNLNRLANAARGLRGNSFPLYVGKKATESASKRVKKIINTAQGTRAGAREASTSFLQKGIVKDLAEGSFNLGVASGVSSVWGGVDQIMEGFIGGAVTGGAFRAIGNSIQGFGPQGDKALRALASSVMQGLPATQAGMTTEEQIYEYLMGAYFGFNELPFHRRQGLKFLQSKKDKNEGKRIDEIEGFDRLEKKTQEFLERDYPVIPPGENIAAALRELLKFRDEEGRPIDPESKQFKDAVREAQLDKPVSKEEFYEKTSAERLSEDINLRTTEGDPVLKDDYQVSTIITTGRVKGYVDRDKGGLKKVWDKEGGDVFENRQTRLKLYEEVQTQWDRLIKKAIEKRDEQTSVGRGNTLTGQTILERERLNIETNEREYIKLNPAENIVDSFSKKYKVDLSDAEHINFWRQEGNRRLAERDVLQLTAYQGEGKNNWIIEDAILGQQKSGEIKILKEEPKLLELKYNEILLSLDQNPTSPRPFKILDSITFKTKDKKGKEIYFTKDFGQWERDRVDEYGKDSVESREKFTKEKQEFNSQLFKQVDRKDGMYFYGGRGDAYRSYFVKVNPHIREYSPKQLKEELNKIFTKSKRKLYEIDREQFIDKYGNMGPTGTKNKGLSKEEARVYYDKATLSNIYYAHAMFGKGSLKPTIKDLKNVFYGKDNKVYKNAKDFNKRQQVWFTAGITVSPRYIQTKIKDLAQVYTAAPIKGGDGIRMLLAESVKNPDEATLKKGKVKANQLEEHEDGAVIVRRDLAEALLAEAGLPTDGGFVKNFIVHSDPVYGALISKHGMHVASPKLDKAMEKEGLHVIVNTLSAKATGSRKPVKYDFEKGKLIFPDRKIGELPMLDKPYEVIPITSIKSVYSEYANSELSGTLNKDIRIPKPLFTNLVIRGNKGITAESIRDMYEHTSNARFIGNPEMNAKLENYLSSGSKNEGVLNDLINNVEQIGIVQLIKGMNNNTENGHLFASRMYDKLLRFNRRLEAEKLEEDGATEHEITARINEINDFQSISERLVNLLPDHISVYLHKFNSPIKGGSLRNYIINELTKPVIGNSLSARMRPYDKEMQVRRHKDGPTKQLNTDENIFFLDEGYRAKKIIFEGQTYTLEQLFKLVRDKKGGFSPEVREKAEEVLNALVVRVPMDSVSGAQVLKFSGFTGASGYGVLLHPKTMKALGGADLDGDKANVYFGDEVSGFHKQWKKMFSANKDEYKIKNDLSLDAKSEKDVFIRGAQLDLELMDSPDLAFSPMRRMLASEGAAQGRGMLGIAVTNKAAIAAAHSTIADLPARTETVQNKNKQPVQIALKKGEYLYQDIVDGNIVYVIAKANTSKAALDLFKRRSRTAINLAADPMDEAGLKTTKEFTQLMLEPLFDYKVYNENFVSNKGKLYREVKTMKDEQGKRVALKLDLDVQKAPIQPFLSVNSALYGYNFKEGRRYYSQEILQRVDRIHDEGNQVRKESDGLTRFLHRPGFGEKSRNSFYHYLSDNVKKIGSFEDSIFRKIDETKLVDLYTFFEQSINKPEFELFKKDMDRRSVSVGMGPVIRNILSKKLYTEEGFNKQLDPNNWDKNLMDKYVPISERTDYNFGKENISKRRSYLLQYLKAGEDFIINDMSDMVSLKRIMKVIDKYNIDKDSLVDIAQKVGRVKILNDKLFHGSKFNFIPFEEFAKLPKHKGISQESLKKLYEIENETVRQDKTGVTVTNQTIINRRIKRDKELLSKEEKQLYDELMLGTWRLGEPKQIKRIEDAIKKEKDDNVKKILIERVESLKKDGLSTRLARTGFGSSEISDSAIKGYLKEYDTMFQKTKIIPDSEVKKIQDEAMNATKITNMLDSNGEKIKGTPINVNDLDRKSQKYIDEIAPFEGLTSKKAAQMTPEQRKVYENIVHNVRNYFGEQPLVGSEFNAFVRGTMNKDINTMTNNDWAAFDAFLTDIRTGSYIQNWFSKSKDPSKYPERSWLDNMLFPESINKQLMRHEIQRVKALGVWTDKAGNVITGTVTKPTQIINQIRDDYHFAQERSIRDSEEKIKQFDDSLAPYLYGIKEGNDFYRVAGRMMEHFGGKVRLERNLFDLAPEGVVGQYLKNTSLSPERIGYIRGVYKNKLKQIIKDTNWHKIKNQSFVIRTKDGARTLKGYEIVKEIINLRAKFNVEMFKNLRGKQDEDGLYIADKKYLSLVEIPNLPDKVGNLTKKQEDSLINGVEKLVKKVVNDINSTKYSGNKFNIEDIGMDGINKINKYVQIYQIHNHMNIKKRGHDDRKMYLGHIMKEIRNGVEMTGRINANEYVPHTLYNRDAAGRSMLAYIKAVSKESVDGKDVTSKEADMKRAIIRFKQVTGDYVTSNQISEGWTKVSEVFRGIADNKKTVLDEGFKDFFRNQRTGNAFKRTTHIEGFSDQPNAYHSYIKNIYSSFYNNVAEISARQKTYDFRIANKTGDKALTERWAQFFDMYAREAAGAPVNIPNWMLNDPNYKIKGTPYAWFADNLWVKRLNKMRKKLGMDKKVTEDLITENVITRAGYKPPTKIISGGQEGIDTIGLQIAKEKNITTGGTAPPDFIRGPKGKYTPEENKKFAQEFGLVEGEPDPYFFPKRTMKNVDDSDGTLVFRFRVSKGTDRTVGYARTGKWKLGYGSKEGKGAHKPVLVIKNMNNVTQVMQSIKDFITRNNIKTLNVAGHREVGANKDIVQNILRNVFTGIKQKTTKVTADKNLPIELRQLDFNQLKTLGQMEAKYQLATLLAHPKSAIGNLYGGTVHTYISTGWEHFSNAQKFSYLKQNINPKWQNKEEVYDWVKSHGVIEEFLLYEANINPKVQSSAFQKTIKDIVKKLEKDPDMADRSLYEIASKNGIGEKTFNNAAWFMRAPERKLRRDAFVAHYLKAHEKFGNMIGDYNNPFLIEMAKKGVKGTQFLYSAPFRPGFSRSTAGKIFTRFQIWAWNSVRFRNQVLREANIRGFKQGTQEYDTFKRLAIADMFMLGLANMFPYSIFEATLPAPLNYFEDTAAAMFGDDRERERAFFGAYPAPFQPLQLVTPPALRLLPATFKAMVTDDYTRLSEYYMWTMFPFGRIARDTVGPGSILENPARTIEKLTGLPYLAGTARIKKEQEDDKLAPKGLLNFF